MSDQARKQAERSADMMNVTVAELARWSDAQLMRIAGIGKQVLAYIRATYPAEMLVSNPHTDIPDGPIYWAVVQPDGSPLLFLNASQRQALMRATHLNATCGDGSDGYTVRPFRLVPVEPPKGNDASELAEALHGAVMAAALYIAIHGGV